MRKVQKKFENVQGLGGKICHKIERDYLRLNNDGVIHVILFHNWSDSTLDAPCRQSSPCLRKSEK